MKKVRSKSSLIKAQFTPPPEDARGDDYELRDGDPLILCNGRTGEILEQYNYDGRSKPEDGDWLKLYQRIAADLSSHRRIRSLVAHDVLWHILASASFGNGIALNQAELAKKWGIAKSGVSKALRELVKLGIVERRGKPPHCSYRLNPNFAWKGTDHLRKARARRWAEEHQPRGSNPDLGEAAS